MIISFVRNFSRSFNVRFVAGRNIRGFSRPYGTGIIFSPYPALKRRATIRRPCGTFVVGLLLSLVTTFGFAQQAGPKAPTGKAADKSKAGAASSLRRASATVMLSTIRTYCGR